MIYLFILFFKDYDRTTNIPVRTQLHKHLKGTQRTPIDNETQNLCITVLSHVGFELIIPSTLENRKINNYCKLGGIFVWLLLYGIFGWIQLIRSNGWSSSFLSIHRNISSSNRIELLLLCCFFFSQSMNIVL